MGDLSQTEFWTYQIVSPRNDFIALYNSLNDACETKGLSARLTSTLCLLVEEVVQRHLIPVARAHDVANPHIVLKLAIPTDDPRPVLSVSYQVLARLPLDPLEYGGDGLSTYLVRGIASRLPEQRPGEARFRVG